MDSDLEALKEAYKTFSEVKNNSGFGWDPDVMVPTAPDSVWEAY
jgi:hypothetical protein